MSPINYHEIYEILEETPVISTHEHHLEDAEQLGLTLDGIIEHSYVSWQGISAETTKSARELFLKRARYNSYFVWLEKGLARLYDFGGRITAEVWDDLSKQIKKRHRDPEAHMVILRQECRYLRALADIYWKTGSDLGHSELFMPVVRTDMFVTCFHPSVRDHDDNSPWEFLPLKGLSFGEYIDAVIDFHRNMVRKGARAFKLATAYERPIAINSVEFDRAARIYMADPKEVTREERLIFGDYIINRVCELAAELGVPYQVHTGLGELSGSNPMLLEDTIMRHPETRFVLFHGGFPWYHEIGALSHNHLNVFVDMVWLPLISTSAAAQALHEYIEVVPSIDRIAWGSDCWTSEEALGALLAFQHVVATVLSQKCRDEYIGDGDVRLIAEKLLYRNAEEIYGL
jgi:predicted TIM-barrel fold metal-dependent hydrolase